MKKIPLLAVLTLFVASTALAEKRTWRDQKTANAIVAELVNVDGDKIVLRLDNGRKYTLDVNRFHKDDQAYVKQWVEDMKEGKAATEDGKPVVASALIRRAIRMSAEEKSDSSGYKRSEDRKTKTKVTKTKYALSLSVARDAPELKNVVLDYTVYKRSRFYDSKNKSDSTNKIVRERGEHKIASLTPGASQVIMTKEVSATDRTQEYNEKKKKFTKKTSEEVMGVIVKIMVGGAEAKTFEYPSSISDRLGKKAKL